MKRIFFLLSTVVVMTALALGAFAANIDTKYLEPVYTNNFDSAADLADFKQYRGTWDVNDGRLYLTGGSTGTQSYILFNGDTELMNLADYVLDVDMYNIQTQGGVLVRSDFDTVLESADSGHMSYIMFISNDGTKGAVGASKATGEWNGNLKVSSAVLQPGMDIHIQAAVKGNLVQIKITELKSGKSLWTWCGSSDLWSKGTFGFRLRSKATGAELTNINTVSFDNLVISKYGEAPAVPVIPEEPAVPSFSIDTSDLVPVYTNNFETAADIADFKQYKGTWEVLAGKLYLSSVDKTHSYILYDGDPKITSLEDYVIDVDMYNIQTQGGVLIRSDVANVTGETESGHMSYMMYVSNDANKGAIGASKANGDWHGNLKVSSAVMQTGMDIHIQAAVKGDLVQITITELESGKLIWTWCEENQLWSKGSFGFRLRGAVTSTGLNNLGITAFDNLVVSTYGESANTVVKITIGQNVGYINGVAKELDAAPIIVESRTMLPVRFVAEAFGAEVGWDGATSTATVKTATTEIKIAIGANSATVNGKTVELDAPAFIEGGRTYLPVRFVSENLGAKVGWDGATSTVTLTK